MSSFFKRLKKTFFDENVFHILCLTLFVIAGSGRTNGNMGSLSEDSNTQDSIPGLGLIGTGTPSPVAKRGNIHSSRGRGRGRHLQELSLSRRKAKLKEVRIQDQYKCNICKKRRQQWIIFVAILIYLKQS